MEVFLNKLSWFRHSYKKVFYLLYFLCSKLSLCLTALRNKDVRSKNDYCPFTSCVKSFILNQLLGAAIRRANINSSSAQTAGTNPQLYRSCLRCKSERLACLSFHRAGSLRSKPSQCWARGAARKVSLYRYRAFSVHFHALAPAIKAEKCGPIVPFCILKWTSIYQHT